MFSHSQNINKTRKPNTLPITPSPLSLLCFLPLLFSPSSFPSSSKVTYPPSKHLITHVHRPLSNSLQSFRLTKPAPTASSGWKCQTESKTTFAHLLTYPPQPLAWPASVLIQISRPLSFLPLSHPSPTSANSTGNNFKVSLESAFFSLPQPWPKSLSVLAWIYFFTGLLIASPCCIFPPHSSQCDPSRQQITLCLSSAYNSHLSKHLRM